MLVVFSHRVVFERWSFVTYHSGFWRGCQSRGIAYSLRRKSRYYLYRRGEAGIKVLVGTVEEKERERKIKARGLQ